MRNAVRAAVLVTAVFFAAAAMAAEEAPLSQLMQNPLFANATPEIRLQMLNQKMAADELDVSSDLTVRLFWDVLAAEPDPLARLKLFSQLEDTYSEFWASSDTENYLLMEYLATTPEAASKDFSGILKMVSAMEDEGVVGSGSLSWTMDGFLALHLITSPEYRAMSLPERLAYLRGLADQGVVSSDTVTDFSLGVISEMLSTTPPEEQQALLTANENTMDGYTMSTALGGYINTAENVALLDPEVAAAATAEEKLAVINSKIEAETFSSSDLGSDVANRLLWDVIAPIQGAAARLAKYKELKATYSELPITTEIEYTLATDVIAEEGAATSKDVLGIMMRIQQMEDADEISWHAVAPLHYGMMSMLLAVSAEYQAMAEMDKLAYLLSFDPQNWASSLTSSEYSEQLACEIISSAPAAEQPAILEQVLNASDFFTKSVVESGYVE